MERWEERLTPTQHHRLKTRSKKDTEKKRGLFTQVPRESV